MPLTNPPTAPGAPGSTNWGGIGGTISSQSDLHSALSSKTENNDARLTDARTPIAHNNDKHSVSFASEASLSSHETLSIAAHGGVVASTDPRLADAREPTSHVHAASDISGTAVLTNDARLSDARVPTTHDSTKHSVTYALESSLSGHSVLTTGAHGGIVASTDGRLTDARTPTTHDNTKHSAAYALEASLSAHAILTTAAHGGLVASNDARLTDARTPLAHTQAENTITFTDTVSGNATTASHGYFPKLPAATGKYLKDDLTWGTPAGGSGFTTVSTSGETTSSASTAFTNILSLTFSVAANTNYYGTAYIIYQTAATTTGVGFAIDVPTGATVVMTGFTPISTTALGAFGQTADITSKTTPTASVITQNENVLAVLGFLVRNGANSGSAQFAIKSEVNTSNVKTIAGSMVAYSTY